MCSSKDGKLESVTDKQLNTTLMIRLPAVHQRINEGLHKTHGICMEKDEQTAKMFKYTI